LLLLAGAPDEHSSSHGPCCPFQGLIFLVVVVLVELVVVVGMMEKVDESEAEEIGNDYPIERLWN